MKTKKKIILIFILLLISALIGASSPSPQEVSTLGYSCEETIYCDEQQCDDKGSCTQRCYACTLCHTFPEEYDYCEKTICCDEEQCDDKGNCIQRCYACIVCHTFW